MSAIDSQPAPSVSGSPTQQMRWIASCPRGSWSFWVCNTFWLVYAGAVAVPLMIGDRLGLSKDTVALLISS